MATTAATSTQRVSSMHSSSKAACEHPLTPLGTACKIAAWSGTSALAAYLIGMHPVSGAIFGATAAVTSIAARIPMKAINQRFPKPNNKPFALTLAIVATLIALPTAATRAAGFPIPILRGVVPLCVSICLAEPFIFRPISDRASQWMNPETTAQPTNL